MPSRLAVARLVASLLVLLSTRPALAEDQDRTLPPQLAFIPRVMELRDVSYGYPGYVFYDWSEHDFGAGLAPRGRVWELQGVVTGQPATPEAKWALVKSAFTAAGWSLVSEKGTQGVLKIVVKGVESDAEVRFVDGDARVAALEVGPNPLTLTLTPPAATPEKVDPAKGDFPYLAPPPAARFSGGNEDPRAFRVRLPGASEDEVVAQKSIIKNYARPLALSNLQFVSSYRDALARAGWELVAESGGSLTAHFGKHGRNVWATLSINYGNVSFTVADGAADLRATLAKDCHVALVGVLFDFNKSTLQPASDPVLAKVIELMKKRPALKLELQGHTDDVGDGASNQKLSEARAASVLEWLTAHQVAAARLTSRGFGKTLPVADNGTPEGRARNRRVELVDPACKPAGK